MQNIRRAIFNNRIARNASEIVIDGSKGEIKKLILSDVKVKNIRFKNVDFLNINRLELCRVDCQKFHFEKCQINPNEEENIKKKAPMLYLRYHSCN